MLAVFLAAYVAAAPLDSAHAAVLDVMTRSGDAAPCESATARKAAANATIRKLGTVGGDDVVFVQVMDPCICGAHNCPYYAIRLGAAKPRVLLSTFGITAHDADKAKPLPGLVVAAHDSALITDETTYAYQNGAYVAVKAMRVRGDNEARKPDSVPVRFAFGASSAQLSGTISTGWFDAYTFTANKGQRLIVDGVRSGAKISLSLYDPRSAPAGDLRAGVPFTLPATGTYRLEVSNDSGTGGVPYTLTLAIR